LRTLLLKLIKITCAFIPYSPWRKKARSFLTVALGCAISPESNLAHQYCDGKNGVEIGASNQNSFGLDKTKSLYYNLDISEEQSNTNQMFKIQPAEVHLYAVGDALPIQKECLDYVISSHVIEHFFDPIEAIKEWMRTLKPGGIIFMIVPHKERTIDRDREITPLQEHIQRHEKKLNISDYAHLDSPYAHQRDHKVIDEETKRDKQWIPYQKDDHHHWSVWTTESFLKMCQHFNLDVIETQNRDDKVGNGFTVILKKNSPL